MLDQSSLMFFPPSGVGLGLGSVPGDPIAPLEAPIERLQLRRSASSSNTSAISLVIATCADSQIRLGWLG